MLERRPDTIALKAERSESADRLLQQPRLEAIIGGMDDMYTLEGLKRAQEDLDRWRDKWADSNSNNPNKFRGNINEARSRVRRIERVLKENGTIPLTPEEQINKDLDSKFPNARSKEIVEHNGKKYQLRFSPAVKSRSGRVKEWDRTWELLKDSE
jgi:hypothetical protein